MINNKTLICLGMVSVLAGCSVGYDEPESGPTATIEYQNSGSKWLNIAYYEESYQCKGRRVSGDIRKGNSETHTVRASGPLTLQYIYTEHALDENKCLVNLRFSPEKDHAYKLIAGDAANSCNWQLTDVTRPSNPRPIELQEIEWVTGYDEESRFCVE